MKRFKETLLRIAHLPYMKYIVVLVFGVLFIGFLDENSVWNHFRYKQRVVELKEEIAAYEKDFERDQKRIHELQHSPKAMESTTPVASRLPVFVSVNVLHVSAIS